LLVSFGSNAEPIVLSDTSVDGDYYEEPFVAPRPMRSDVYDAEQTQPTQTNFLINDISDPLFLVSDNKFLSDTYVAFVDDKLRIGQYIGYGINNNLVVHANMHYQVDFTRDHENGFSSTEFGGTYRMNHGTGDTRIISDALFGLKLWGASRVRSPEYADSSYYAGLRFGRQFTAMTLSGTVKSTWVFDDNRGVSYIDFIPEVYFRFKDYWRSGFGFDLRRSTNPDLMQNQEWINLKLLKQFGNTQYVGKFDYEFESHDILVGLDVKILF
ncbi:MAG: hypothetical protein J6S57_01010, partial [Alphaproteobacteria bacterium]|nr:hypothetical protein [Alphaproteobacteria bacterium]